MDEPESSAAGTTLARRIAEMLTVTKTAPPAAIDDDYFEYRPLIDGFNEYYHLILTAGHAVCIDESMFYGTAKASLTCQCFHGSPRERDPR
jgi:hypothetical protein